MENAAPITPRSGFRNAVGRSVTVLARVLAAMAAAETASMGQSALRLPAPMLFRRTACTTTASVAVLPGMLHISRPGVGHSDLSIDTAGVPKHTAAQPSNVRAAATITPILQPQPLQHLQQPAVQLDSVVPVLLHPVVELSHLPFPYLGWHSVSFNLLELHGLTWYKD